MSTVPDSIGNFTGGSNKCSYFVVDTAKESQISRFLSLACSVGNFTAAFVLLCKNEEGFSVIPAHEFLEVKNLDTLFRATLGQGTVLETGDLVQRPKYPDVSSMSGKAVRSYTGVVLKDEDGSSAGVLCLLSDAPKVLSPDLKKTVLAIGEQVSELIGERKDSPFPVYMDKAFRLSDQMICIMGKEGFFKKINQPFVYTLGFEKEFLLSKSIFELVPPKDAAVVRQKLQEISEGKDNIQWTQRLRTKKGEYKDIFWAAVFDRLTGDIFAVGRDISEEKAKQNLLEISENKFRTFFENSQGLMYTHDLEGNFLSANHYGSRLLGYSPEELMGKNLRELIPEEYHNKIIDYLREVREEGRAKGMLTTIHKDGNTRKVWIYNNSLAETPEGMPYVIGNSMDITERLKLEKEIQDTKELLQEANKMARIGGWKLDLNKNRLKWTESTRKIHEVGDDFILTAESGICFFEKGIYREKIAQLFENAIVRGESWDERLKIVTAKGNEKWVRIIGRPTFERGKCVLVNGSIQDINSEYVKEEEIQKKNDMLAAISSATDELLSNRDFYEAAHYSLILLARAFAADKVAFFKNEIDEDGNHRTCHNFEWHREDGKIIINDPEQQNIPFRMLKGYLRDLTMKKPVQVVRSESPEGSAMRINMDRMGIMAILVVPILYQSSFWGFVTFENHKGESKWSTTEISLITTFSNSISNAIDRKILERNLIQAKEQAEFANEAKSAFLANMSHEIRTPLNGIIGFTDLLLQTSLDRTQEQYLNIVHQSGRSLLNVINDILDFSKIEAGKLDLNIERCDIYDLVSQAADVVSFGAHSKGLEMLLNVPHGLPRYIFADETRMTQILVNLLGNAIKFTSEGEIELKITSLFCSKPDQCVFRFEVRDTGIGIAKDKQEKIFEAFSQESESIVKKYGGTGLGLSISNKLLALMGSTLQVSSEPGKGSTFFFDISLKSEEGESITVCKTERLQKAIIVDDNERTLEVLSEMFAYKKIQADKARNAYEALRLIEQHMDYNVLLVDYQMPGLNGIELIKKISGSFPDFLQKVAVILMYVPSEQDSNQVSAEGIAIRHHLIKPVKIKDLYGALSEAIEGAAAPAVPKTESSTPEGTDPSEYNILLAEDNATNMMLSKILIEKICPNALIHEANDGVEAYEYCLQQRPDIIFMDIQMPRMNGFESARKILKLPQCAGVPVIALSASNVVGEREKSKEVGMVEFLTKPMMEQDLRMSLHRWLGSGQESTLSRSPSSSPGPGRDHPRYLNVDKIKEYLGDDPVIISELLLLGLSELEEAAPKFSALLDQKNLEGLREAGHKLKGTCVISGLDVLLSTAKSFENLEKFDEDLISQQVDRLLTEIRHTRQAIENYVQQLPPGGS